MSISSRSAAVVVSAIRAGSNTAAHGWGVQANSPCRAACFGGLQCASAVAPASPLITRLAGRLFATANAIPSPNASLPFLTQRPIINASSSWRGFATGAAGALATGGVAAWLWRDSSQTMPPGGEEGAHLVNWSGTREVHPRRLYQPETLQELEGIVAKHHETGQKLRPVGSALSPNGLGFGDEGDDMVCCSLMDSVLSVDRVNGRATVRAGARISDVVEALRPHGLTLQNIASIREQAMGGFLQVGAHGSGAAVPPMDEQVVAFTLVTPGRGTLRLSKDDPDPELFYLTRVGLGACGVVAEVELQCVPSHHLLQHTYVTNLEGIRKSHHKTLSSHRHARYMWIPHTDAVVVVTCDPHPEGRPLPRGGSWWRRPQTFSEAEKTTAFQELLLEAQTDVSPEIAAEMSFSELRDRLLAKAPLDKQWVTRVNTAEADFWRRNSGYTLGPSDSLLGFDCGGQQWVLETAFPAGTLRNPSGNDLAYMEQLLSDIEASGIAAPSPIEQRWCSRSTSAMSPASSADPDAITSWVGIIMYLPEDDVKGRETVTAKFNEYVAMAEEGVAAKFGAVPHWAKVEIPTDHGALRDLKARLAARYPLARFAAVRKQLDPKNILGNRLVDTLLPPNQ